MKSGRRLGCVFPSVRGEQGRQRAPASEDVPSAAGAPGGVARDLVTATPARTLDYEGKPTFLVDASGFPGSSGSPVFLMKVPSGSDKHGNVVIGRPAEIHFLGVVAAVYERAVPVLASSSSKPFVRNAINGIVYKGSTVIDTIDHFDTKAAPSPSVQPSAVLKQKGDAKWIL